MQKIGTIIETAEQFGVPTENIPAEFHAVPVFRNGRLRTSFGRMVRKRVPGTDVASVHIEIHKCVFVDPDQMRDTLAHEIAHVIAGIEAGHGPAWRRAARSVGHSGERCATQAAAQAVGIERAPRRPMRPVAECDRCGYTIERRRALPRSKVYTHRRCGGNIKAIR